MRICITELLTSGGWPEPDLPPSLVSEGRAMITALLADARRIEGVQPVTLWDATLAPLNIEGIEVVRVTCHVDEPERFRDLTATADAAFVIAPEIDQLLESRIQSITTAGGRHLGCGLTAVRLVTDKWQLARFLEQHDLPTIPTAECELSNRKCEFPFPVVVKPRCGAGSQDVRRIDSDHAFQSWLAEARLAGGNVDSIVQPFVPGRAISAAAIVRNVADDIDVLPVCEQRLSDDGRFTYLGGLLDCMNGNDDDSQAAVDRLVKRACLAVDGLRGYVGFDLIVPFDRPCEPIIVEINPRLTTSYLGYRKLTPDNLAERFLFPDRQLPPIRWDRKRVQFDADGTVVIG